VGITFLGIKFALWVREHKGAGIGNATYLLSLLPAIVLLWDITKRNLYTDFYQAYYPAGLTALSGDLRNLYLCDTSVSGFVNIPIVAYLFAPIATLSGLEINILLTVASVLIILLSLWMLFRVANIRYEHRLYIGALFALNGPLVYSIKQGNSTHVLLPLLILALFWVIQSKRLFGAGVILGLLTLIKIPFGLFALYFLLRKYWKALGGFISIVAGLVLVSVVLLGIDIHLQWFNECILGFVGKPMAGYNVQSIDGFWARLLTSANLSNWTPLTLGIPFRIARNVSVVLLLGVTIWRFWKAGLPSNIQTRSAEFCSILCLAFILSPISWTYYYLYMLIPASLYIAGYLPPMNRHWKIVFAIATFLVSLPVLWLKLTGIRGFLHENFLVSHYLIGGLMLLFSLLASLSRKANNAKFRDNFPISHKSLL
jgi:hypothetical protein